MAYELPYEMRPEIRFKMELQHLFSPLFEVQLIKWLDWGDM
jgi:hypothetical protein